MRIPAYALPWPTMSMVGFVLFSILLVVVSFAYSSYTWDLVAYVMAALDDGHKSSAELHAQTWALIKDHVPGDHFEDLIKGPYREEQYRNPDALVSMLPMYNLKVGYIFLLKALSRLVDPIHSFFVVSAVSTVGITFVMFLASRHLVGFGRFAWLPIVGFFNIFPLAQLSTPDAPSAFLYCAGLFLLLRNNQVPAIVLFLLGAAIRPDNVVLNVMIALIIGARSWPKAAGLFFSTCAIYLAAVLWAGHGGWWLHFYTSLVDQQATLVGFSPAFSPMVYARALAQQTSIVLLSSWIYGAIGVLMFCLALLTDLERDMPRKVLYAVVASGLIHFFVFPTHQERIYGPYLFGIALVMLDALDRRHGVRSAA
ncbi:MAG: hypothetical protein ACHQK9_11360 [Reyranellales bacterium]